MAERVPKIVRRLEARRDRARMQKECVVHINYIIYGVYMLFHVLFGRCEV